MAISRIQQASATANTVAITTPASGDMIVVAAFNGTNNTVPPLAAGYTTITSAATGTAASQRTAYKISNGTETDIGIWTNATAVAVIVFRGAHSIGGNNPSGGTSASISYPATTLQDLSGASWVVGFGANVTSAAATAPTGMTLVTNVATLVASDTEAGRTTNWTFTTVAGNGNAAWSSAVIEIRPVFQQTLTATTATPSATLSPVLVSGHQQSFTATTATMSAGLAKRTSHLQAASTATENATLSTAAAHLQALSASMATFAGALTKQISKAAVFVASMATMAAVLTKQTGKSLIAATAQFSGALVKSVARPLVASMAAFSGSLVTTKTKLQALAASMAAMSATLAKSTAHTIAASTAAFSGAIVKFVSHLQVASSSAWTVVYSAARLGVTHFQTLTASMASMNATLSTVLIHGVPGGGGDDKGRIAVGTFFGITVPDIDLGGVVL